GDTLTYALVGTNGGAAHGTVSLTGATAHYTPTVARSYEHTSELHSPYDDASSLPLAKTSVGMTLTNAAPTVVVSLPANPKTNDGHFDGVAATDSSTIAHPAPLAATGLSCSVGRRSPASTLFPYTTLFRSGDTLTYALVGTNGGAAHGTVSLTGATAHYTPTVA